MGTVGTLPSRGAARVRARRALKAKARAPPRGARGEWCRAAAGGEEATRAAPRRAALAAGALSALVVPRRARAGVLPELFGGGDAGGPPKRYLDDTRKLVSALRDSVTYVEDSQRDARRKAAPAQEAVRLWLSHWKAERRVSGEQSYAAVTDALRALGEFYAKNGPVAPLTDDVRDVVLAALDKADAALAA